MTLVATKVNDMLSTLEKEDYDMVISYIQFLSEKRVKERERNYGKYAGQTVKEETIDDILENIVGAIPDTGKTLAEYRDERIRERYGIAD